MGFFKKANGKDSGFRKGSVGALHSRGARGWAGQRTDVFDSQYRNGDFVGCGQAVRHDPGAYAAYVAKRDVGNVTLLLDKSGSMPDQALHYMAGEGLSQIAETLIDAGEENGIDYYLHCAAFSSGVQDVLPFCRVDSALEAIHRIPRIIPSGPTLLEPAICRILEDIDGIKREQDKQIEDGRYGKRIGSTLIVVTDGKPSDEKGRFFLPLSDGLVEEIARLNRTREVTTFAVGMGEVDNGTLKQIAPSKSLIASDGEKVEYSHALRYKEDVYHDLDCWRKILRIVIRASSATGAEAAFCYPSDAYGDVEVVPVDPNHFEIVR